MKELKGLGGECNEDMKAFNNAIADLGFSTYREMPRGAIIGTAILEASVPTAALVMVPSGIFRRDGSPGVCVTRMRSLSRFLFEGCKASSKYLIHCLE
ncbi:MAG: hypothetical protein OEL20_04800 [Sulfuritalea sp.]|nr:hypothetical protein [Sulfuritalea sp.]